MTYRQIEELSITGGVRVAPSTLCGAFTRGTLPRRPLTASFLKVIGLTEADQQAWLATWQAIKDGLPVPASTPVLPTRGWLVEVPASEAFEADVEVFRAAMISRGGDSDTDGQGDWVIPTYLPTEEIRDWRFQEGYWQDVEPVLPPPPARVRAVRARFQTLVTEHPALAQALLLTVAVVLTALAITGVILAAPQ